MPVRWEGGSGTILGVSVSQKGPSVEQGEAPPDVGMDWGLGRRKQSLFPCPPPPPPPLGFPLQLVSSSLSWRNLVHSDRIKSSDLEAWVCVPALRPASWVTVGS